MDTRLLHEIAQGRSIAADAEALWGWTGKVGSARWTRRARMLSKGLLPRHSVLEVGCGTGLLTEELAKTAARIQAIDISPDLLARARERVKESNVTFVRANAYDLECEDNTFDFIIGMSVLHHLDVDKALREFHRVLKKGGRIVFSEPNMLNPQVFIERLYFLRAYFHNTPDETAFVRFALNRTLQYHGFAEISIRAFDFLHPKTPAVMVGVADKLSRTLEQIPIISEIAGSLFIEAIK